MAEAVDGDIDDVVADVAGEGNAAVMAGRRASRVIGRQTPWRRGCVTGGRDGSAAQIQRPIIHASQVAPPNEPRLLCRMHLAALALAALVATAPPSSFDDAKKKATPVPRLASTIAAIVGVCPDGLFADELAECQQNVGKAAKSFAGKEVYLNLGGGLEQFLSFESKTGDRATLVWAPIIDLGNGLAMTLGKPQKLNDSGGVVVARQPFEGFSDPELLDSDLQRSIKTGQVGIEVIGTFGKPWELKNKDTMVRGVAFDARAIRFFHTRTGKVLVEVTK